MEVREKRVEKYIIEKLQDPNWDSHHEVRIKYDENKHPMRADWLFKYSNKKAIIIEDKEYKDSDIESAKDQLLKYKNALKHQGYKDFITIAVKDLQNQIKVEAYHNDKFIGDTLESLIYYEQKLGAKQTTDLTNEIYSYVKKINNMLHEKFVIKHLNDRMIFAGVVLVACKYTNQFVNDEGIQGFKKRVVGVINGLFTKNEIKSKKINDLTKAFLNINIGTNPHSTTIQSLCELCGCINDAIKLNPLCNIDIMNIFFTEFNRYRGKSEHGQIFTPDHIASFMSKLIQVNENDVILDPTCGSGSLLVKASNLNGKNWDNIYGNDFDLNVLYLSYINMLLHNDGITNFANYNAIEDKQFIKWIKEKNVTKVVANPPYEKSGAINILNNVINNVKQGCRICWLMPNTKMEKIKNSREILKKHRLTDIVLLPDIFAGVGCGDVSLFIFTSGLPQNNEQIRGWWLKDDGFETVKNEGYKDIKHKWEKIESNFLDNWNDGKYNILIDPNINLSYPKPSKIENVVKEDFEITLLQYMLFKVGKISSQNTVDSCMQLLIDFMKLNNQDEKLNFLKKIAKDKNDK